MTAFVFEIFLDSRRLALQHVEEVGVAADVQLHRLVEVHAALAEEAREHAVRDRRADLRLDVVADDRQAGVLEAAGEVAALRDEDGHAVHHRAAGLEDLLRVPLGRLLGADRQVVDDDVRLRLLEDPDHVVGVARRLLDDLREVLAEPVVRHPARDGDARLRDIGELDRVVRVRPDRVGEIGADLALDDVERRRELDVADVVAAEVDVHEAGDELVVRRVLVELDALEQRVRAVADADDRDAHLVVAVPAAVAAAVGLCHAGCPFGRDAEPLRERLDDQVVRRPPALGGAARELVLELRRHPQEDVAGGARRGRSAAGRRIGDGEARRQRADGDVVQALAGRRRPPPRAAP